MSSKYARITIGEDSSDDDLDRGPSPVGATGHAAAGKAVDRNSLGDADRPDLDERDVEGDVDPKEQLVPLSVEDALAEEADGPYPWGKTLVIFAVVCANGIALTASSTFLPRMVQDRFGFAEVETGNAVGILAGAFSFMQFFSSFFVGHLSDVYGRKPLVLTGTFVCFACVLAFGFSPTFSVALANRAIEGFFNSNIPVCKAVIGDVVRSSKHRAFAFGLFGASFSMSRVLSAAMSGILSDIATPGPPMYWEYVLPCVALAPPLLMVVVAIVCCLPETSPTVVARRQQAARGGGLATTRAGSDKTLVEGLLAGLQLLGSDGLLRRAVLLYCVNSFCNGGILVANILFLSLGVDRLGVGMNPSSVGIALSLFGACAFLYQILVSRRVVAALKPLKTYIFVGCTSLCLGCLLLPISALPVALTSCYNQTTGQVIGQMHGHAHAAAGASIDHRMLAGGVEGAPVSSDCDVHLRWLSWLVIVISLAFQAVGFMSCLPMVTLFTVNAAPRDIQGLAQGTAQSLASLLRSIGPFVSGALFSVGTAIRMPFLAFAVLGAGYLLCLVIALGLPKRIEQPRIE